MGIIKEAAKDAFNKSFETKLRSNLCLKKSKIYGMV